MQLENLFLSKNKIYFKFKDKKFMFLKYELKIHKIK